MTVDRRVQQGAELKAGQMLSLGDLRVLQRERDKHSCCLGVFHELQTAFTSPYEPRWKLGKSCEGSISMESQGHHPAHLRHRVTFYY